MTDGIPEYEELKIRIERGPEGRYGVLAFAPDGSTAQGAFTQPFSETELDNFILRVGLPRRSVRAYRSSHMEEAKQFGTQLFDALVSADVREVYQGAKRAAEGRQHGLRVTLYLTGVPELMEIPWEFLYERRSFLSQSIYTPLVRSLDLKDVRPPTKLTLPIHILGMVSRPTGFDNLDVDAERRKLETALAPAMSKGLVDLRWLETATLSDLERTISAPDDVHVFHYIGHGTYDKHTDSGILVLEDRHGRPHEVTGEELGAFLQDERSLRLTVLNSCEGARTSHVDPFSGVASSLVDYGVPAVIGMQFEITDDAAITFADRLYTAVAQGFPVDAALAQARKAIFAAGYDVEFGTPVLFLRAADARLFELDDARPAEPVPEPARPPAPPTGHFEPANDMPLRADELRHAGGLGYGKERATFMAALVDGERVYLVGSANRDSASGTSGLMALTDRRLLFTVNDGTWDEWPLDRISGVEVAPGPLTTTLRLKLVDGSARAFCFFLDKSSPKTFERLLAEFREGAPVHDRPAGANDPVVEVLQRGPRVRTLRVKLRQETHTVKYSIGVRDKLEVDGQVVQRPWMSTPEGHQFELSDGDALLPAVAKIGVTASGMGIADLTLIVDNRVVYTERPS